MSKPSKRKFDRRMKRRKRKKQRVARGPRLSGGHPPEPPRRGEADPLITELLTIPQKLRLQKELREAQFEFFGEERPTYAESEFAFEQALGRMLEWFVFDRPLATGETPFQRYLDREGPKMSPEKLERMAAYGRFHYSTFEIMDVRVGEGLTLRDLSDDREYDVEEVAATYQVQKGECFIGRIFPRGDRWHISGVMQLFPRELAYRAIRQIQRIKEQGGDTTVGALVMEEAFHRGRSSPPRPQTLAEARRATLKTLKRWGLARRFNVKLLERQIAQAEQPMDAFGPIIEAAPPKALEELMDSLQNLWNLTPRPELGGRAPDEVRAEMSPGPQEEMLRHDLIECLHHAIGSDQYASPEEASAALSAVQQEWLDTPQDELDGRTPREVIHEERRQRGHPYPDGPVELQLSIR